MQGRSMFLRVLALWAEDLKAWHSRSCILEGILQAEVRTSTACQLFTCKQYSTRQRINPAKLLDDQLRQLLWQ